MYALQVPTYSPNGLIDGYRWTDPARLCKGQSSMGPAVAEQDGVLYVAYRGLTSHSIFYETFNSPDDLASADEPTGYVLPIQNTIIGAQFTALLLFGNNFDPANLLIDTGSSSLAVLPKAYDIAADTPILTSLAQADPYGSGVKWIVGPIVQTSVSLPLQGPLTLPGMVFLDIDVTAGLFASPQPFGGADGILGLAYTSLSQAQDFSFSLASPNGPAVTFPWPWSSFSQPQAQSAFTQYQNLVLFTGAPTQAVPPFFTQIQQEGLLANQFALWVNRSLVSNKLSSPIDDLSNWGTLILGGGYDFYVNEIGPFQSAAIADDTFYSVILTTVQVGENPPLIVFQPGPIPAANSFVDSGTAPIELSFLLFQGVLADFKILSSVFSQQILQGSTSTASVEQNDWPILTFTFSGATPGSDVSLICTPDQYWQSNAPSPGLSTCMLTPTQGSTNIFGLTLLTGYYTIFDRSVDGNGVINFAQKPLVL